METSTYKFCLQMLLRIAASKSYDGVVLKSNSISVRKMLFDKILRILSFGMHVKNIWKFKPKNSSVPSFSKCMPLISIKKGF